MKSVLPIEIPKRAKTCLTGQEAFLPGMEYYSILTEDAHGEVQRQDYCLDCWEKVNLDSIPVKSVWKSKVLNAKDEKLHFRNRDEKILHLFKELQLQDDEFAKMETYVLSIFLMRRKILLQREELDQAGETMILYEVSSTEEMLLIKKYELTALQIGLIQLGIAEKLKG